MLKIRKFVQGRDETVWVSVANKAFKEFDEFHSNTTVEDMMADEKAPTFDATGLFIAELDGEPVGIVNAYVDKIRAEKKGFINVLGVVPEHRRKGIGRALVEKALESFRERGMEQVESGSEADKLAAIRLLENMGFKNVRVFSQMKKDLRNIPSGVGENSEVQLRKLQKSSSEDVKLLTWLGNESFSEYYNFRPGTVEETRYSLEQHPVWKVQEWVFADLENSPVGYIGLGINPKYNKEKNTKAGWIIDIGVLKPNRRRGIGTRLMIEGMKLLKAKGMNQAMLGVDDQNITKAIKLYEKLGFQVTKKSIAYQKIIRKNA